MKIEVKKIFKKLKKKNLSVSFAESCTGGLLSSSITSISGSSKVFDMGLVTYSNKAKIKILRVNTKLLNKFGAVSPECCKSMVNNLSKISKSKVNVSITGIAGPKGGTKEKPVGLVYIGFKIRNKIIISKNIFKSKKRNTIQKNTVIRTLYLLNKMI